ncbi:MAG TPA: alkaline phosphatase family protein [Candidatus Eisenbacteria bacterium]|nr:alkaline phosphatase family protein [Candidatus Eisenbacteria bacterium]
MKLSSVFTSLICAVSFLAAKTSQAASHGKAEHIVVVVWDGMRPDFIRPQYTPRLYQLARGGVFFKNHHALYISSTEVNGTGLATGVYPDRSGIMSNSDYRPEIGWLGPQGTESLEAVRRGDWLTEGNYLQVPTIAEILQRHGQPTIIAGTKPVALLFDRALKRTSPAASNSVMLYRGRTIPSAVLPSLIKVNDDKTFVTNVTHPNLTQDAWTTKALTHGLWKKGVPKFTLLWLSEPDASQHETGPGSDVSISALESSDKNLAEVLKMLDEKKVLDKTDVFVVSDHGFSTIFRGPDVVELLKKAKFKATRKFEDPEPGDVLVVGLGGSMLLYVIEHEAEVVRRLVEYFQSTDFTGVIFSRTPQEGTFPLDLAHIDTTNAPDLVVSFRWSADKNEFGTPGMVIGENGKKGKGTHASLSHFDMNNTLVAAGPDFQQGFINELPTGNADLVPTILSLLGVTPSQPLDGRILTEALVNSSGEKLKPEQKTIEATRDLGLFRWRQYLKFTTVGNAIYFDEGNGESVVK